MFYLYFLLLRNIYKKNFNDFDYRKIVSFNSMEKYAEMKI